ncbi:MAG: Chemotaxis response regulator protein-glutamate methylesterase 4, partial [Verrucomicrobiota bacterium]
PADPGFAAAARNLADTVVLMSEVRVVRRWQRRRSTSESITPPPVRPAVTGPASVRDACLLVIGASTGGPVALHTLLARLPRDLPVPVLIVQHISPGFLPGMASWLQQVTGWPVRIAHHGETANGRCPATFTLVPTTCTWE